MEIEMAKRKVSKLMALLINSMMVLLGVAMALTASVLPSMVPEADFGSGQFLTTVAGVLFAVIGLCLFVKNLRS